MNPSLLSRSASALFLALLCAAAQAQDVSRRPTTEAIVRSLNAAPQDNYTRGLGGPATRGLSGRGIAVEGAQPAPAPDNTRSIDLDVTFEYNSAVLSPDARLVLDNLGRALNDPSLRSARFMVAGHTDASGGDAYNLELSRKRAQAVADYLKREHGVTLDRLQIEGFGRSKLLDTANPLSAVNRRVQVVNLGG